MPKNLIAIAVAAIAGLALFVLTLFGGTKSLGGSVETLKVSFGDGFEVVSELGTATFTVTKAGVAALTGSLKIGSSGTAVTRANTGVCYFKAYATTIAATSSAYVDCQATAAVGSITGATTALTGVTFGDNVVVNMSTTTAGTVVGGLVVGGVSASTTAGHIQMRIVNLTGATYTWPTTGTATGTASYIVTDL